MKVTAYNNIKFVCASRHEFSQTIRTTQLVGRKFRKGEYYFIKFEGNTGTFAYVNRNNVSTLYVQSDNFPSQIQRASVGRPIFYDITLIGPFRPV